MCASRMSVIKNFNVDFTPVAATTTFSVYKKKFSRSCCRDIHHEAYLPIFIVLQLYYANICKCLNDVVCTSDKVIFLST